MWNLPLSAYWLNGGINELVKPMNLKNDWDQTTKLLVEERTMDTHRAMTIVLDDARNSIGLRMRYYYRPKRISNWRNMVEIFRVGFSLSLSLPLPLSPPLSLSPSLSFSLSDVHWRVGGGGAFRGGSIGGQRGQKPPKISKKRKMKKYGVFSCIKVIKISFSVIFNEEIGALEGLLLRF